jgi:hypothetical protein
MKYPDTEPICSCDECIYKDPKRERCRKMVAPLPSGRRCSASIHKTSKTATGTSATASTKPNGANARLMAAAPELLEALQEIITAADGEGWSQLDAGFTKARAAISKAIKA